MSGSTISRGVTSSERVLQPPAVTAAAPQGVWVIVVNYNTADLLERCLEALRATQLDRPCTVFVVDNGSRDASVARVRERFPEVVLLETGANVGFARANNLALRRVLAFVPEQVRRAHAVLLVNSDCFVEPETIQRLVGVLDRGSRTWRSWARNWSCRTVGSIWRAGGAFRRQRRHCGS